MAVGNSPAAWLLTDLRHAEILGEEGVKIGHLALQELLRADATLDVHVLIVHHAAADAHRLGEELVAVRCCVGAFGGPDGCYVLELLPVPPVEILHLVMYNRVDKLPDDHVRAVHHLVSREALWPPTPSRDAFVEVLPGSEHEGAARAVPAFTAVL
eukprot:CAMPEP_0175248230 /NCGR_PEP_ID=MMETSP0093-20121207/34030_1 /TAXON_ID=311494 /ORGANISM="Alexandrium monilatum, Strain CCMP3105" /LENGTH=155 /DNA_ID=CAMNT_0016542437 /DNA_START=33 /DNA_END=500 /DNA_ORIENTATION=+